jgi:uncharacterized membrane protein (DUF2068 family)
MAANKGLRAVAIFEVVKGVMVLAGAVGALHMLQGDTRVLAERIAHTFQLDPTARIPRLILERIAGITRTDIWLIGLGAIAYAAVRLIEAYGLWKGRAWAEWLAVVSGGLYLPIEIQTLIHRPTWIKFSILVLNILVVVYLAYTLVQSRKSKTTT